MTTPSHAPPAVRAALVALLVTAGCVSSDQPRVEPTGTTAEAAELRYRHVATEPCPESRFECITLAVPRDHFSDDPTMWEVTFGIQRADGEAQGTFVTVTGGPGSSGLYIADYYTDLMAPEITDAYDIVFLDQRGVGASRPMRCDEASAEYARSTPDVSEPTERDAAAAAAETFVDACLSESGVDPRDLPYYSTLQAVEDLEALRDHLGVERLHLYGESYGTQYVQTYAAVHPERVAALVLDGVVDLTVDLLPYYAESAKAHDDLLGTILDICADDDGCATDAAGDAADAYDALVDRLAGGPLEYDFPLADGTSERRELTRADLDLAVTGFLNSLGDRMLLQRALAAAVSGNLVPLARLAYTTATVEPDSLDVVDDPSWSEAMFYAVECQDYDFSAAGGTPRERFDTWIDGADDVLDDGLRLDGVAYGDVPCFWWPATDDAVARPAPIVEAPYPTLVLNSDVDAPTPVDNAVQVFSRLEDAYLVVLQGGPHVIFDWGYACVDDLVSEFLATGTPPSRRVTICDGDVTDPYVPLAPADASGYDDPQEAMRIIEDQVLNASEYVYWAADAPLGIGCDFGGSLEYVATGTGTDVELDACELTEGVAVSGSGSIDDETGDVDLDVQVSERTDDEDTP